MNIQLQEVLALFLEEKTLKTRKAYQSDLKAFMQYLRASSAEEGMSHFLSLPCSEANFLTFRYRSQLINQRHSSSYINRSLTCIRSFVKFAHTIGIVEWTLSVKNVRKRFRKNTKGCGFDVIQKMLFFLRCREDPKSIRDYAIMRLLYDLGLRRSEVVDIKLNDIDIEASKVLVKVKGYREKEVLFLSNTTLSALKRWLKIRGEDTEYLFYSFSSNGIRRRMFGSSIYRVVKSIAKQVGVTRIRPHGIRHTAVTEACKMADKHDIPLEEVLQFSRHKDVRTLMIYRDQEHSVQKLLSNYISESTRSRYEPRERESYCTVAA